jgi:hypothetical protein
MRIATILPLTALIIALPLGARAEEHPAAGDHGAPTQVPPLGTLLERLDVALSAPVLKAGVKEGDQEDEPFVWWTEGTKEKVPEVFIWIDGNGNNDGHLKRGEVRASVEKAQAMIKEQLPALFARIDADGDGTLSRDEVQAARAKKLGEQPEAAGK